MCDITLLVGYILTGDVGRKSESGRQYPGDDGDIWEEGRYQDALSGRSSDWELGHLGSMPAL